MIEGMVYRVRTNWEKTISHCARKGSLVVIQSGIPHPDGTYMGQAMGCGSGNPITMFFRPCDLQRLGEYHEEINE